jgi:hypothetical protein
MDREWSPSMRARGLVGGVGLVATLAAGFSGCKHHTEDAAPTFTRDALLDPTTCGNCHQDHFKDWSGSMHAYAGEDPVFLAMNRRLQRETGGQLGDLCVRCHAPMAVREGLTKDGLNLASLAPKYRGVTCFFCHTADAVGDLHNNGLRSAADTVMRGGFDDPVPNAAHHAMRAKTHDQTQLESSDTCGSCHDIVTPGGAHIERTYEEWKESLFAKETGLTCGSCHMAPIPGLRPVANVPGVFARQAHTHTFAGVDRALTDWPNTDAQKKEIQDLLDASIQSAVCVSTLGSSAQIRVVLDNVFAGHTFPSGATADRRVWVELIAKKAGAVVYQSGVVDDGTAVLNGAQDPDLWLLRDVVFDRDHKPTDLFGLAACYESHTLPFPVTANPADPRFYQRNIVRDFHADGSYVPLPDTVTMRLRITPVGFDVLDGLISSGDLDPAVRRKMEVMQVGPTVTWTPGIGQPFIEPSTRASYECVTATNQNYRADKFPPPVSNTCGP